MNKHCFDGACREAVRILKLVAASVVIAISVSATGDAQHSGKIQWAECLWQKEAWYSTGEAIRIADNLLLYQFPSGGWPKNIDMAAELSTSEKEYLRSINHLDSATIDNSSTYPQLRYLARVYNATKLYGFKEPFLKGFDYLLRAQYANGGWPQFFPLREGYYSHITFNDDAMIGVMRFLKDVTEKKTEYAFVDDGRKLKAAEAVHKGIDCILRCQIRDAGTLVAWCAQHDERDFSPAKARTYELPSVSGGESVGIIEFLMSLENPSDEIKNSVQAAVAWFKKVEIKGIKELVVDDTLGPEGRNRIVVTDPSAPPMWARFYEIGSNRPFFCSRDGIKRFNLSEISYERRNHYSWLGYWPEKMLTKEYPEWAKKNALKNVLE